MKLFSLCTSGKGRITKYSDTIIKMNNVIECYCVEVTSKGGIQYGIQVFGEEAIGVYVAWWTNKTGNDEVLFRASTDAEKTFGDKINLSNTTDADSRDVEIDSDADSVVVTWWETNETSNILVMRVSDDNGKTFGPLLNLATNGTLGESAK